MDMEEAQNQSQETQEIASQREENKVSFPTVGEPKKGGGAKTLLIIGILILVGILGYVIYRSASGKNEVVTEPTPFENEATGTLPSTNPTSSPSATIDKSKYKIQIQNGTGITGEAAYLEGILKGLGYTNITVGNAATQSAVDTQVSFSSTVPSNVVTEVTTKLESIYQSVKTVNSTSTTYDIVIITGLRKGVTPKPTASPTTSPSTTPTPTSAQ
jgi:hypothetical protein